MTEETAIAEVTTPKAKLSRDEMRAKIFGAKPKSVIVEDFFGVDLELRQPSLEVALNQRDTTDKDRVYFMLTQYAYVPNTNEKLFDPEDVDSMRELPFGPEFTSLMDKVNSLLGVKPEEVEAAVKAEEKSA